QVPAFGELENLARAGLLARNADHAVVHGSHFPLLKLVLDLGVGVLGRVMAPADVRFLLAQRLAGKKLDDRPARPRGELDGLEHREAVEGPALAAEEE